MCGVCAHRHVSIEECVCTQGYASESYGVGISVCRSMHREGPCTRAHTGPQEGNWNLGPRLCCCSSRSVLPSSQMHFSFPLSLPLILSCHCHKGLHLRKSPDSILDQFYHQVSHALGNALPGSPESWCHFLFPSSLLLSDLQSGLLILIYFILLRNSMNSDKL